MSIFYQKISENKVLIRNFSDNIYMIELKFKERLRELRKNNGLTQKVLALEAKVAETSITDWERGRSEPCLLDLTKLAIALNTTIDYLVGKDEIEK